MCAIINGKTFIKLSKHVYRLTIYTHPYGVYLKTKSCRYLNLLTTSKQRGLASELRAGFQSGVAAPWLSSANLNPTRIECFKNFSAHLRTHVSSCLSKVLRLNVSTQSVKHRSTSVLYILRLQWRKDDGKIIMKICNSPR